jgi:O-antigen/teichoic acid export membrane protein
VPLDLSILLKKSLWPLFFRGGGALLTFVMFLLVGRATSAEGFGFFSLYLALGGLISVAFQWGMPSYIVKKLPHQNGEIDEQFQQLVASLCVVIVFSVLLMLVVFLFYSSLVTLKLTIGLSVGYSFVLLSCLYAFSQSFLNTLSCALNGLERNAWFVFYGYFVVPCVFVLVLSLCNVEKFYDAIYIHITVVSSAVLMSMITLRYYFRKRKVGIIINFDTIKKSIGEGRHFLLISIGAIGLNWVDTIVIGFFVGAEEVARYTVASRVVMIFALALVTVNAVITPMISRLYLNGRIKELKKIVNKSSIVFMISGLITVGIVVVFGRQILILFGSEYAQSYNLLLVLLVGQFVNLLAGPVGPLLTMTGKEKELKSIVWQALILNIILSVILAFYWGAIGVAYSTSISLMYWNIKATCEVKSHLGFWPFLFMKGRC